SLLFAHISSVICFCPQIHLNSFKANGMCDTPQYNMNVACFNVLSCLAHDLLWIMQCLVHMKVLAYLLLSSSSAAASTTNRLRDNGNMRFTDMAVVSVSMSFITFALMAASSVLSGYALSKRIR
ncbi:hypothetical protein KI387_021383, partial [Taxus chinensis]